MKVNELKGAMDAQFTQMKKQFAKVDQQFAKVDQQFAKVDEQFAKVDERFAKVDEQFANVDERFAKVDWRLDELDRRITSEAADLHRHFDVVAEQMKSDIALLAGAVVAATERLDRTIAENRNEHTTIATALDDHELRLRVLEHSRR